MFLHRVTVLSKHLTSSSIRPRQLRMLIVLSFLVALGLFASPWGATGQVKPTPVTTVSAANYARIVSPDSIAAAFGTRLAPRTESATSQPLPTSLAGTTVRVNGELAPLFFVSADQVNYLIPPGTPLGLASVVVISGDGTVSQGTVEVASVAPGLFTANSLGTGALAGQLLRITPDNRLIFESLSGFDGQRVINVPIQFGPQGDQLFLVLYLTGMRRAATTDVQVNIGGEDFTPIFVGKAEGFTGLDQINVPLSRTFNGRGQITLFVKAAGNGASQTAEFAVGAGTEAAGQLRIEPPAGPLLAGEEIEVSGTGFAANKNENTAQIGQPDETPARAEVLGVSGTTLRLKVPFGAATGKLRVSRGQIESSADVQVRTSVSGFVERVEEQPDGSKRRFGIAGLKVRLGQIERITDESGSFVLPDVPAGNQLVQVIGSQAPLNYPDPKIKIIVKERRDNQIKRGIKVEQIALPGQGASQLSGVEALTAAGLTLTFLKPGRTPADLPPGHFSTRIAQLTPFGENVTPGMQLRFPNSDGIPAGTEAKLFKMDQTTGSDKLGQFVEIGVARVSADGQVVETAPNAITEGSYYFVSIERQTGAVNGRVVESDGRPVPRAVVQVRGQSVQTDGYGGFVIPSVPVLKTSGDKVRVEVSYMRPDASISRKDGNEVELRVNGLVTVTPVIVLDAPVRKNQTPLILAPTSLTLTAGETREFDVIARDSDTDQAVQVGLSGSAASFTTFESRGAGVYRLRLSPGGNAAGNHELRLHATDGEGAPSIHTVKVTVEAAGGTTPKAHGQAVTTIEDGQVAITLTGRDPGGKTLTYSVVNGPQRGTLSGMEPNVSYRPGRDYNGTDSFTFRVNNGTAQSEAVVFIGVSPVNDPPVLSFRGVQEVTAGETLKLTVSATDVDGDQNLRMMATDLPPGATFAEEAGATRELTWAPTVDLTGTYEVKLTVIDSGAPTLSETRMVTLKAVLKWTKTSGPEGGAISSLLKAGTTLYAGTLGGGVYRSDDEGGSWRPVNTGLSKGGLEVLCLMSTGVSLYVGTDGGGVYRSDDGGANWRTVNTGLSGDALRISALTSSSTSLYAGTNGSGVYRSADGGANWRLVLSGYDGATVMMSSGTSVYAGTWGRGVYRSVDGGMGWATINAGLSGDALFVTSLTSSGQSIYAGTDGGGVYRSDDGGTVWRPINAGLSGDALYVIALTTSGQSLYAATYDGVYRSDDGAASWRRLGTGVLGFVYVLMSSGTKLYAGNFADVYRSDDGGEIWTESSAGIVASVVTCSQNMGNSILLGTLRGVYRSDDAGASWRPTNSGLSGEALYVYDLTSNGQSLYAATYVGVYRSDDGAASWRPVNTGFPGDEGRFGGRLVIQALAFNGASLYAGTDGGGVYRTDDGGANWRPVNSGLSGNSLDIYRLMSSGTSVYAGSFSNGVYRSDDGGTSWRPINAGLSGDALLVNALMSSGQSLYVGTHGGGVYRSDNGGTDWRPVNSGLSGNGLYIYRLMSSGASMYAGTFDGVFRSDDGGGTWRPIGVELVNQRVGTFFFARGRLFAGTYGNGVWSLSDADQSWVQANGGLTNRFTNALILHDSNVFAGTLGGVFRSADEGGTWTESGVGVSSNANIQSFTSNGPTLWVGTLGEGVYRSTDGGQRWQAVNNNLTNKSVNKLLFSGTLLYAATDDGVFSSADGGGNWMPIRAGLTAPRVPALTLSGGVLYAGTAGGGVFRLTDTVWSPTGSGLGQLAVQSLGASGGTLHAGTLGGGIFISRNGGGNWAPINNGLPQALNVYAFAFSGRKVYAGTIYGVFVSEDEGGSWKQVNAGLLNTFITGLAVRGDRLYASTASAGIFISRIPE